MHARTIISLGFTGLLALGNAAIAQEPAAAANAAAPPAYAVPVETIAVGKGNQGFFESGFSISGYQFTTRESYSERSLATSSVEARQTEMTALHFTFSSPAKTVLIRGVCGLQSSGSSVLFFRDLTNADVYDCRLDNLPTTDYALAVSVPQFTAAGTFSITVQVNRPEKYKAVKAVML